MQKLLTILLLLITRTLVLHAQEDSIPSNKWRVYGIGASYTHTATQYFEGYNHNILISNARAGLPIYSDWNLFTSFAINPEYQQGALWFHLADASGSLRMRVSASVAHRTEYMSYRGSLTPGDTLWGRDATERTFFAVAGFSLIKSTKLLWKFLKLYAGAELELGFGGGSNIEFREFRFDVGEQVLLEENTFMVSGKPRFNPYGSALLGFELCFLSRLSLTGEVKSGVGGHIILNETTIGLSKSQLVGGLNYYFQGY